MPAEFYQTIEQIVTGAGFLFEEYKVTTADDYILNVFRIKNQEFTEPGAPVVFF